MWLQHSKQGRGSHPQSQLLVNCVPWTWPTLRPLDVISSDPLKALEVGYSHPLVLLRSLRLQTCSQLHSWASLYKVSLRTQFRLTPNSFSYAAIMQQLDDAPTGLQFPTYQDTPSPTGPSALLTWQPRHPLHSAASPPGPSPPAAHAEAPQSSSAQPHASAQPSTLSPHCGGSAGASSSSDSVANERREKTRQGVGVWWL